MKMISLNEWKEIEIKDFCIINNKTNKVPTGANIPAKELLGGDIPKISASGINNGVVGYYNSNHKNFRVYDNFISVSFLGSVFYQEGQAFLDMKVHCIKPKEYKLNKYSALFLVTVIKKTIESCSYSDQISAEVLTNLKIKLPFKNEKIDWKFMEEFEKTKEKEVEDRIKCLEDTDFEKTKIDTSNWTQFKYNDFFEEVKIKRKLDRKFLTDSGDTPVYSSETTNNGIKGYTNEKPDYIVSEKVPVYVIFGDHTKSFHFATKDFCVSDNVKVLKPKVNSIHILIFITTSWGNNIKNLGYARHWNEAKKTKILLPAKNGIPDWEFMEKYIDKIDKENRFIKGENN